MPVERSPVQNNKYNLRSNPILLENPDDSGINTTERFESTPSVSSDSPTDILNFNARTSETESDISNATDLDSTVFEQENNSEFKHFINDDTFVVNSLINGRSIFQNVNITEENLEMSGNQGVSLKDALECVPIFDGKTLSIYIFLEGCEEALLMLPEGAEGNLVKMIRTRLTGEARRVIQGQQFGTLVALTKFLKSIYAPAISTNQIRRELGSAFQKLNEDTISYANHIREIGNRITEAQKTENDGELTADQLSMINKEIVDCFLDGLIPELQLRITGKYTKLDDAVPPVIMIEKKLAALSELRGGNIRSGHTNLPPQKVHSIQSEVVTCQICRKTGHEANTCRHRNLPNPSPVDSSRVFSHSTNSNNYGPRDRSNQNHYQNGNQNQQQTPYQNPARYNPPRNQNQSNITQTFNPNHQPLNTPRNHWQLNSNVSQEQFCNYCKNPGHVKEECRKLAFNNSLRAQSLQNPNSGNSRSLPATSATRETSPAQRNIKLIGSTQTKVEMSE